MLHIMDQQTSSITKRKKCWCVCRPFYFLLKMKNNLMKWIIFKKRKKIDWISKPNFLSIPLWLLLVKPIIFLLENKIKLLLFTSPPRTMGYFTESGGGGLVFVTILLLNAFVLCFMLRMGKMNIFWLSFHLQYCMNCSLHWFNL